MGPSSVDMVIGRALVDDDFRRDLTSDVSKAVQEYGLTDEEVAALCRLDADELKCLADELAQSANRDCLSTGNCM